MRRIQIFFTVLLGLVILVGVNVLVQKADWQVDLTKNKRYSLSNQSKKIVQDLKDKVTVLCFYRPGESGKKHLEELLKLYARESKNFSYEFIDPDRAPALAKEYDIYQSGQVVVIKGKKREKLLFPNEEKLTNALIRLCNEEKGKVYIVKGHGEESLNGGERSIAKLDSILAEEGVQVEELSLLGLKEIPKDALAVLILGPKKDFLEEELKLLQKYLAKGGRLFIALAPEEKTNLTSFVTSQFKIKVLKGFILDPVGKLVVGSFMAALAQDYPYHAITDNFNVLTVFPTALGFELKKQTSSNKWKVGPLLQTGQGAWLETDIESLKQGKAEFDPKEDMQGPIVFAFWAERSLNSESKTKLKSRVLVFGDDDFFTDKYIGIGGNKDLLRNALRWIRERDTFISISKPKIANSFLFLKPGEKWILTWVPLVILPLVCLFMAILVVVRRRWEK
ncbi:GldG family protein [Desulfonauticus submarinus]